MLKTGSMSKLKSNKVVKWAQLDTKLLGIFYNQERKVTSSFLILINVTLTDFECPIWKKTQTSIDT